MGGAAIPIVGSAVAGVAGGLVGSKVAGKSISDKFADMAEAEKQKQALAQAERQRAEEQKQLNRKQIQALRRRNTLINSGSESATTQTSQSTSGLYDSLTGH